jgi:hypothetical protein
MWARKPVRVLVIALVGAALLVPSGWAAHNVAVSWDKQGFVDLRGTLWDPGKAIRDGSSPYPKPTPVSNLTGSPSVYPPPLILVAGVPLSLLPFWLAAVIWGVVLVGSLVGALALLDVRDWRCYAIALLSAPFVLGAVYGNATPLLVLLVAAAWRYRDRPWAPGLAIGGALAIKPFVAPLLVWLAVTRRWRSLIAAVAGSAGLALAGWAVIGFKGFRHYPELVGNIGGVAGPHGASIYALARNLGASHTTAELAGLLVAAVILVWGRASFQSALLASLVATPVVWPHYFALLFVVAAIESPTLSALWFVPLILGPGAFYVGSTRPTWVTAANLAALVIAYVYSRPTERVAIPDELRPS